MPPNETDTPTGSGSDATLAEVPAAWAARATELAGWALERIFVRTDRHGGYATEADELRKKTFPTTGPHDGAVNLARLERHFRARSHEDIIGAHTLAPGTSVGRWCALDCDNHGDDPQLPERNRSYAEERSAFLTNSGFRPLVLDYGNGSIHIVVLFDRALPGAVLKRFAEWLRDDEQQHEVFPKQSEVPEGKFGNWLRLVGRHHTRDVWARVYDGANWLDGAAAVAHLLALTGDSPDLIPEAVRFPQDAPKPEPKQTPAGARESVFETYNRAATLDELIGHCEAEGHKLLRRESDRATFTRAGKTGGESFNLRAMHGTVFCYNFSANAGLPSNKGLNPSHTRCALMFGSVTEAGLRQLAPILEAELGVPPRRMPPQAVFTNPSAAETSATDESEEQRTNPPAWWQPPCEGEAWTDPNRLARLFVRQSATPAGAETLVQWRDEFFRWDCGAYRPLGNGDLHAQLNRHAREVFEIDMPARRAEAEAAAADSGEEAPPRPVKLPPVTAAVCTNTRGNLAGLVNVPDDGRDAPFWLNGGTCIDPSEVIAAPSGLFTLEGIACGDGPFMPPTPDLFTLNALPFDPVQGVCDPPKVWCETVLQWFDGDNDTIAGLQEWFGYLLSGDTAHHKILLLTGPPRSGKGTILRVLSKLVGSTNVATTSFAALGESFGLQDLIGKRVAVIPDARLSGRTDSATVVERLLSISGDDAQTVNRKNLPRISTRLGVRFVLATNEIPKLADASGALASRFHILAMSKSFLRREDKQLDAKLAAELPAVLQWAARGYVRLRAQGAFTQNAAAERHHRHLEELTSPVRAFVRERCTTGATEEILKEELYNAWCDFCEERSLVATNPNVFSRDLYAAYPHVTDSNPRRDGARPWIYRGIGLRPCDDWGEPELCSTSHEHG